MQDYLAYFPEEIGFFFFICIFKGSFGSFAAKTLGEYCIGYALFFFLQLSFWLPRSHFYSMFSALACDSSPGRRERVGIGWKNLSNLISSLLCETLKKETKKKKEQKEIALWKVALARKWWWLPNDNATVESLPLLSVPLFDNCYSHLNLF